MKNKHKLDNLTQNYVKIPIKLLGLKLNPEAISLYCMIAKCPEGFNPSVKWLSDNLNMSRNTVAKYLQELESRNIITCYDKGHLGKASKWQFNAVSEWKE